MVNERLIDADNQGHRYNLRTKSKYRFVVVDRNVLRSPTTAERTSITMMMPHTLSTGDHTEV
ncbi:hypothetical protein [Xylella fastidiosa]|uniref:hypothetical protein n=1 Tax=Xylella fastidiosa TaxID=2371 RepID=UPI000B23C834|nr:hypothetical protein [Xylella fastidiosa]WNY18091.1 hypothetical protein RO839_06070 [Xylella fastidiosa]WNY20377.1 hypothetical protein RO838_06085 [Xylella fastidiosa]